ncbi:MAG: aspartate kinase [Dongiaceae bacterium]
MARIVLKFGGTSVAGISRIRKIARLIQAQVEAGDEVAVVTSAMAGATNQLVALTKEASKLADGPEYDAVISSGEQVVTGLLSLALQAIGVKARSFQGWQIPLYTDEAFTNAFIHKVEPANLNKCLREKMVPVIAGFQGITQTGQITTLGRGGSDTTAVAIAAAIKADRCDIYTDVDGIYTTDPRIVPGARKLDKISYEEILELASQGAKVLQTRSVEIAMRHKVKVQVLSSFTWEKGTLVVDEKDMDQSSVKPVSGIAYSKDDAKISLRGLPDTPDAQVSVFTPLARANISVDMIAQAGSAEGHTDITFTVPKGDLDKALEILKKNFKNIESDNHVVKVSVVGLGMRSHSGIAEVMFKALAEKGIKIQVITTSEIKISVLIAEEYLELALRALHAAYGLEKND